MRCDGVDRRTFVKGWLGFGLASFPLGRNHLQAAAEATDQKSTSEITTESGIDVSVSNSGQYNISIARQGWNFGGDIGAPLRNLAVSEGQDSIGSYREITFLYDASVPRKSGIRIYRQKPAVVFTTQYLDQSGNVEPFPSFNQFPGNLLSFTYTGVWSYAFNWQSSFSPWIFFDGAGNSLVLSPANHYVNAYTSYADDGAMQIGIDPAISQLPAGFTYRALLVFGGGINATLDTWGRALTDLNGKNRPANDSAVLLRNLSYWTDALSTYYYNPGDAAKYVPILKAVKAEFDRQGVPLGSMELDSWYYPKGSPPLWTNNEQGMATYQADTNLFPCGLSCFQKDLGLSLITHARWIDRTSDIRKHYQMSGDVSVDPNYWKDYAQYLRAANVGILEQDWLSGPAVSAFNLTDPDAFHDRMAQAMKDAGLNVMYCMPRTRHFMQSSKYDNVIAIRVSDDGFRRERWDAFLYNSRLASAVGLWPFADAAMSNNIRDVLLATLSAGPLGIGDDLGSVNGPNLRQAVRADGVIVKPDDPIVPIDAVYIADAAQQQTAPMIAATRTRHGDMQALYIFAYERTAGARSAITFSPAALGLPGQTYVYDYFGRQGQLISDNGGFTDIVDSNGSYYIVASVGESGMALLGDAGKFVSRGKQRIAELTDDGILHITISFAAAELRVVIYGYSPSKPLIAVLTGGGALSYDANGIFQLVATPDQNGVAKIELQLQQ